MRFREKLARFMIGRYGPDPLYNALFVAELIVLFTAAVLNLLGQVAPALAAVAIVLYILALAMMVFSLYRFFSRNIAKRRRENQAFLRLKAKLTPKKRPSLPKDTDTHVFRSCPKCSATLRLPRQAGKHQAKCPRCGKLFRVKVK